MCSFLFTPMAARAQETLPDTIPLFPLQDVMLFPGVPRPLHIFEPRYQEMLLYALVNGRVIGMVMLEPGHEDEYFGKPPIYPIGCAGVIESVDEISEGRFNIVLKGLTKFRVTSEDKTFAYRVAEVEAIPETLSDEEQSELRALRPRLLEVFSRGGPNPAPDEMPDRELVNGLAQYTAMEPRERLRLLELDSVLERARALLELFEQRALLR